MADDPWTEDELRAAVVGYLRMLRWEAAGQAYVKADVNRELRSGALASRSHKSVDYRMANISSVRADRGESWISGYKPLPHVGPTASTAINRLLDELS